MQINQRCLNYTHTHTHTHTYDLARAAVLAGLEGVAVVLGIALVHLEHLCARACVIVYVFVRACVWGVCRVLMLVSAAIKEGRERGKLHRSGPALLVL